MVLSCPYILPIGKKRQQTEKFGKTSGRESGKGTIAEVATNGGVVVEEAKEKGNQRMEPDKKLPTSDMDPEEALCPQNR